MSTNRQFCLWSYERSKEESLSRQIQICLHPTSSGHGAIPDSGLEFCRELLGLAGEDPDVGADRDEEAAALEPAPRVGFDAGEDPRRLARFSDAADRVVDDRHDFRIVG